MSCLVWRWVSWWSWVSPKVYYPKVPTSSNPGGGVAELLGLEVGQLVGVGGLLVLLVGVGFSKSVLFKSAYIF
jgi:hypothetical protein